MICKRKSKYLSIYRYTVGSLLGIITLQNNFLQDLQVSYHWVVGLKGHCCIQLCTWWLLSVGTVYMPLNVTFCIQVHPLFTMYEPTKCLIQNDNNVRVRHKTHLLIIMKDFVNMADIDPLLHLGKNGHGSFGL